MIHLSVLMFYLFSGVLLTSAVMVVTSRNTVHSVLFLILTFVNAAALFVLAHAEFLAMMLVVVYVGAVAVLFLFVVMMLNVELGQPFRESAKSYSLIGLCIGGVLAVELTIMIVTWNTSPEAFDLTSAPATFFEGMSNTQVLGNLLYTHYALIFQGAGLILLIAMMGAIVLTLRHREGVRKQNVREQIARTAKDSVRLIDIPSRTGI